MEKSDAMKEIRDEVLTLTSSPLYEYRTQNKYLPVIREGMRRKQANHFVAPQGAFLTNSSHL